MANPKSASVVILTHEHTDFDALASMLAASKLYPQAVPILPRNMNRNLRAFLAIYSDVLPFIRLTDLRKRRIDHVILVDTQTIQPIRGLHANTTGHIIDHHPASRELPPGWTLEVEETGAITTFLVERLAEQAVALNPTEATLLMLGIYEDTGGLSYETTTPRDLRSAAWLLASGANLRLVDKFLHHPLTDEQRQLYQQLADNSHPYQFHGHPVIIATAAIPKAVEEISTLAHKLRDLYEPDGLFLIVEMGDRIQVVARSTSEAIDVGKIAAALGGGGHSRAAAALVRQGTLHGVYETLVYLLQSHVQPTVTVEQIMSHGVPQTLAPSDTIAEAADRVKRYGFEGFPVVEDGHIVGMLTRREIDRASHHGLDRHPVSRYMRSGEVYVTPSDSVETLRRVMTEQGWGQVPVLDPQKGNLLGIVTRTDLIKQWSTTAAPQVETLSQRMGSSLPGPLLDLLKQTGETARQMNFPLFAVGGFVRDLLLDESNYDVDLVVEGDAIKLAHRLADQHGGRVRSHRQFGTAKWILPDHLRVIAGNGSLPESLDFVTARTEYYERPSALPTVERSSIKQDLHRRDFTINTLAICLTPDHWGELLDFYGGRKDLEDGQIRVLHSLSFVEDPTRILRAVRFEQRFRFQIEPRTALLIAGALDLLDRVSAERIRHELELIFAEAEPERALCRLDELGVLSRLHPELRCDAWLVGKAAELRLQATQVQDAGDQAPPRMAIDAGALPRLHMALSTSRMSETALNEFLDKFHVRKDYRSLQLELRTFLPRLDQLTENHLKPSQIVEALDESSDETRLLLRVITDSWLVRQRLDQYQRRLRHIQPILDGDDLRRAGIRPGRIYRELLNQLRAAQLDGEISTHAEAEALISTWTTERIES